MQAFVDTCQRDDKSPTLRTPVMTIDFTFTSFWVKQAQISQIFSGSKIQTHGQL